jgi:hypothetical protein
MYIYVKNHDTIVKKFADCVHSVVPAFAIC